MRDDTAPAIRQDQPADSPLGDVLSLARAEEQLWPELAAQARSQGLVCMAEEEEPEPGEEESPTPDAENPDDPDNQGEEEPSFLDDYDLGEVPPEARSTVEAYVKRLSGAYTKQRQQDTQAVREAENAKTIVEALHDPELAPIVLQRLGIQAAAAAEDDEELEWEEGDGPDPNQRIDELRAELAERDQLAQQEQLVKAENAYVTEQIEHLEEELKAEFSDEELEVLYVLAEENRDGNGAPDVKAAHRIMEGLGASVQRRVAKQKLGAPRGVGRGKAGTRQVDLTKETPEERRQRMAEAAEAVVASRESP